MTGVKSPGVKFLLAYFFDTLINAAYTLYICNTDVSFNLGMIDYNVCICGVVSLYSTFPFCLAGLTYTNKALMIDSRGRNFFALFGLEPQSSCSSESEKPKMKIAGAQERYRRM